MAYDRTRLRLGNYDVSWTKAGGSLVSFGLCDKITPDLELVTLPKKAGSIGDVALGEWIIDVRGTIKTELREIDLTTLQNLCPWYTSGSISLIPATWHKDVYDYAGLLTLHPNDIATATTTQDLNLLKAFPTFKPMARDGITPDKIEVTWRFFPDLSQLVSTIPPLLVYGYWGTPP